MSSLTLSSPAKVNLFLKVLRKRSDGYHDIATLMQAVSLYDRVSVETGEGEGVTLWCSDPMLPDGSSNLAYRAADLYLKTTGVRKKVSIRIEKNIPVGAGLGGGSSNAATVLKALDELEGGRLGHERLLELSASLGSDCPFFISGKPAYAEGRGERLKPVDLPKFAYILINPGFQVSTAWAYSNLDLTKNCEDNILTHSGKTPAKAEDLKTLLVNDLEEVTLREYPVILGIKNALVESGAIASLMSGSGPTVFGVFNDRRGAEAALTPLRKRFPDNFFVSLAEGLS
ncbi:MAG: 4-(cytidine 5'-diphospho)-2-C-methyl-D-erythritol kinase [Deltaproteobacteria bacterium GWB2_55_19]|nr:MAG: 4-(cytidine 5'-diphospho)-2-C-methyl-D-erythritol kinase [Deltaproteobacteria bacterium GWB2_55_19]HAO93397.1 4-(cytidine 5'-diphospho)-2-C-methyl-D-erythritol kinase [Deltaproteobacteria bacterium]